MPLRDYQRRAVDALLASRARATVLVLPTGGGKTRLAATLITEHRAPRVAWLAHRVELLEQACAALRAEGVDAAICSPRHKPDPHARVQVCSIDTLVARGEAPEAQLVVHDECHHVGALTHGDVLSAYRDAGARIVGLTATPQRGDGRTLGDVYDELLVAARYSDLLRDGRLVPCRVFPPHDAHGQAIYLGSDLGCEPVDAWQRLAQGRQTVAFARDVAVARELAAAFVAAGVPAACVDGRISAEERADALARFRGGELRIITNVHVLTEGTDVPEIGCVLLARGVTHAGTYLQMVGRALRPAPGKRDAILIDLPGACALHGVPTADREYALEGRAIKVVGESIRNCPECGYSQPSVLAACESCGYEWPKVARREVKVWDYELRELVDRVGIEGVGVDAKRRELDRLLALADAKGWSAWFAQKEYKKLFNEAPPAEWLLGASEAMRRRELESLRRVAQERGYKRGWVMHRYKALFGALP